MSMTGLDVFDRTVHKTNSWLNELMEILGWDDRHKAYLALRVTLHALRDRLTVEETARLLLRRLGSHWQTAESTGCGGVPRRNRGAFRRR